MREHKLLNALVYFIIIITVLMLSPLIYKLADAYSNSSRRASVSSDGENVSERNAKTRKYTVTDSTIDISGLRNTDYGTLSLIRANITDGGDIILFCSARLEIPIPANDEDPHTRPGYEDIVRIASIKNIAVTGEDDENDDTEDNVPDGAVTENEASGVLEIYQRPVRNNFLESLRDNDYIFKDYGDGTFFLSNSRTAFLFDIFSMRISSNYTYPQNYNIYQAALSNNKDMLALATEEGFFIGSFSPSMPLNASGMKELIATVTVGGVKMSARNPVWSNDDERIYYKLYADNYVRNAGVTTSSPGGNEQLTALDCNNFLFLDNDSIFYYFSSSTETSPGNSFRCGYFNITEKKMNEVMKSQVFYSDIAVSSKGTHLAALSKNGNMTKISIIDIRTKKLICSSLYEDISDFSFSPDEKNVIIYGRVNNRRTLKVINIDWTEE